MKSFQVVDFNAPLKEVDQPTPQPSGTQVLIKVKAAGVCHSDLHIWEGGYDLGHGRKPLSLKDRGVSLRQHADAVAPVVGDEQVAQGVDGRPGRRGQGRRQGGQTVTRISAAAGDGGDAWRAGGHPSGRRCLPNPATTRSTSVTVIAGNKGIDSACPYHRSLTGQSTASQRSLFCW